VSQTNKLGKLEYIAVMRHRDLGSLLPVPPLEGGHGGGAGADAAVLDTAGLVRQPLPERDRPLSYETQLKWVNEVFGAIGLSAGKKTHLG
jgi:hypothetical protein